MRKLILFPCAALLTAAAPASAQPQVAQQIAPSDAQKAVALSGGERQTQTAPEEKKICKQLPTSGSRLPNRACLTAKQWKQVEDDLSR
jgi:hypothetical protein